MLDPEGWLAAAQELPLGGRKVIAHDCGDGPKLVIEHKPDGWSAWCYRCSDKGWHPAPTPSLAERLARLRATQIIEEQARVTPGLPGPANYDPSTWPLPARVWLYKAGISNERIVACGFYYCERLSRVVMPVSDGTGVVFWQARGFERGGCKYLSPAVDRTGLAPEYRPASPSSGLLVVTEDILSAVRVGEVYPARSLMGTSISDRVLLLVAQLKAQVCVWLDNDKAGRSGAIRVARSLALHGVDTRIIHTERDPKFYSRDDIKCVVTSALQAPRRV